MKDCNYRVSVEFEKFSKKFENVPEPRFDIRGNSTILIVEDRNREIVFNWDNIHYYCCEAVR